MFMPFLYANNTIMNAEKDRASRGKGYKNYLMDLMDGANTSEYHTRPVSTPDVLITIAMPLEVEASCLSILLQLFY